MCFFFLFIFSPCAWHLGTPLGFDPLQWPRVLPWQQDKVPSQVVVAVAMVDNSHGCLNAPPPPPSSLLVTAIHNHRRKIPACVRAFLRHLTRNCAKQKAWVTIKPPPPLHAACCLCTILNNQTLTHNVCCLYSASFVPFMVYSTEVATLQLDEHITTSIICSHNL